MKLTKLNPVPTWRRISAGAWKAANDPTIYGTMLLDMTKTLEYMEDYEKRFDTKITVTHMVAKAVSKCIADHPDINACIRFGRIYLRDQVDLFLQVVLDDGDLSGHKIQNCDKKSLRQICEELRAKAKEIREQRDPQFKKTKSVFKILPQFLVKPVLWFSDFVGNTLGLEIKSMGIPRDPFGSAMITSVGMMGIEIGLAPFFPVSRTPFIALIGMLKERPMVVDGKVVPRQSMWISATFDHRLIDGYHAGFISREVRDYLENPTDEVFHPEGEGDPSGEGSSQSSEDINSAAQMVAEESNDDNETVDEAEKKVKEEAKNDEG